MSVFFFKTGARNKPSPLNYLLPRLKKLNLEALVLGLVHRCHLDPFGHLALRHVQRPGQVAAGIAVGPAQGVMLHLRTGRSTLLLSKIEKKITDRRIDKRIPQKRNSSHRPKRAVW